MDAEAKPGPEGRPDEESTADEVVDDLAVEAPEARKVGGAIKWSPRAEPPT
jgi:hypothetical protein